MARANQKLINALRQAAIKINASDKYQWGHMGYCNCGFVAQELTQKSAAEIHQLAMQGRGDWNDQCTDYCETSGMPFDEVISQLTSNGLSLEDIKAIENLSHPEVLETLPIERRNLERNNKRDAIFYLNSLADYLEAELMVQSELTNSITSELTLK
ncbi:hypothetical protein [Reichenbachiella versicolor]|uniref:hypothetical protein n=1 Tax=Reichenbachiella versicolor TaxID=1821036 RepID=UPI000D6E0817|nr:hypothetical protein [Reichenbachiella versicolor]